VAKRITTPLILLVLVLLVVFALSILCTAFFPNPILREADLRLNQAPLPPAQPIQARFACSRGLIVEAEITGDWYLTRDHPPCTVGFDFTDELKATPAEMRVLRRRPQVAFKVAEAGTVASANIAASSGSRTLDDRAVKLIQAHTFPKHNCGVCRVSTQVNLTFAGPFWINE
jgi:TonB family protein